MLVIGALARLPNGVEALVWRFALAAYHSSATRVRHRRMLEQVTRAAYEKDRKRHFERDTVCMPPITSRKRFAESGEISERECKCHELQDRLLLLESQVARMRKLIRRK